MHLTLAEVLCVLLIVAVLLSMAVLHYGNTTAAYQAQTSRQNRTLVIRWRNGASGNDQDCTSVLMPDPIHNTWSETSRVCQ